MSWGRRGWVVLSVARSRASSSVSLGGKMGKVGCWATELALSVSCAVMSDSLRPHAL